MKQNKILDKVHKNKLSAKQAYHKMFKEKRKYPKAHFVKINIKLKGKWGVNMLLYILLFLPIPLWIVKKLINRKNVFDDLDDRMKEEILELIEVRGIQVDVNNEDVNVSVKTI